MKIQTALHSGDSASAQAVHRALQCQGHGGKAGTHRYERRKVREYLRHAEAEEVWSVSVIENARLQS